jgi:hypothetical protein
VNKAFGVIGFVPSGVIVLALFNKSFALLLGAAAGACAGGVFNVTVCTVCPAAFVAVVVVVFWLLAVVFIVGVSFIGLPFSRPPARFLLYVF